jgi:transcriptional regulator with XRE-family HTH domain
MNKVHEKIKQIRELKNYSREYLANSLGISARAYGKIESGETQLTINRLVEIAKILGVTPEEILGFDASIIFNNGTNQQGGEANNTIYNQTEIKHVQELYEKLLHEKDLRIKSLEEQNALLINKLR